MKYNASSVYPSSWDSITLKSMFKNLKEQIVDKVLPTTSYEFGRKNLLKNTGIIEDDQEPHFNYREQ